MDIKDLVVPELDWEDIVQNPWTFKGNPEIKAEIEATYVNEYRQRLKVVGKNTARGELYVFYDGKKDIAHFITVRFDNIVKIG